VHCEKAIYPTFLSQRGAERTLSRTRTLSLSLSLFLHCLRRKRSFPDISSSVVRCIALCTIPIARIKPRVLRRGTLKRFAPSHAVKMICHGLFNTESAKNTSPDRSRGICSKFTSRPAVKQAADKGSLPSRRARPGTERVFPSASIRSARIISTAEYRRRTGRNRGCFLATDTVCIDSAACYIADNATTRELASPEHGARSISRRKKKRVSRSLVSRFPLVIALCNRDSSRCSRRIRSIAAAAAKRRRTERRHTRGSRREMFLERAFPSLIKKGRGKN